MSSDTDKPVKPAHTPYPYHVGQSLTLRDSNGAEFSANIIHEYPFTISPAVVVNFHKDGVAHEAVLKLYDRRFGETREIWREPRPHSEASEAAFQDCARNGLLSPIMDHLKQKELIYDLHGHYPTTEEEEEEEKRKPEHERLAKEEARFYLEQRKCYNNEVRVYDRLKNLQGRGIPQFLATVTFRMPFAPSDLEPSYFHVPGILIQKIDGFNLTNLVTEMPNGPPEIWTDIIQKAVDLAVEINRAGVLDEDSQPRNALVTRRADNTFQVYRIDFGQAELESDVVFRRDDDPDIFKKWADHYDDPYGLGGVMASKVETLTGIKLNIVFEEIFPGVGGIEFDKI
ncbi:hypothetical protein F4678DRAFT_485586 [Xylaria arbuscula]|nr:hypothetical protein F4678DRAFT_485586 [Xylaria arbuscula]